MKIAVLGTGMAGRTIAARLAGLGHEVTVGTRDVAATRARTDPDAYGNPGYGAWAAEHPAIGLATFADAAAAAYLLVNATSGAVSLAALQAAGEDNLDGKILIDVANPLDFSAGFPPTLFVKDTDSLGEQIQTAFPRLKVVKTLNTMTAPVMMDPKALGGGDHTVFLSGDDAEAKRVVTGLLESLGHTDAIDLGDISTARGTEMVLPLWLRLMRSLGTPTFNFKVVR
ncbi:MAG: NAD(P)-binding domain-containing protein [Hamadaea sp.]|nr:NAD(P)-binding domain-containing protein [Hamadaea sp.]